MSLHYFALSDLMNAYDGNTIKDWITDHGEADPEVAGLARLEWARENAEGQVRGRVVLAPGVDLDDWEIDLDPIDGMSDNVPVILKNIAIDIALYRLASRRGEAPDSIRRNFDIAEMNLKLIVSGDLEIIPGQSGIGPITGNMTKEDLGELTENGEPLQWSEML